MTLREALDLILNKEHLEDYVYHVRDAAAEDPRPSGCTNSWDHPRVKAFTDACERLKWELAELNQRDPNEGR